MEAGGQFGLQRGIGRLVERGGGRRIAYGIVDYPFDRY